MSVEVPTSRGSPSTLSLRELARRHGAPMIPGLLAVGVMLVWATRDGGYDASTWYWGALVLLSALTVALFLLGPEHIRLAKPAAIALGAFALYVAWSYLSILWARSPGDALEGSNRALLYLIVFTLLAVLPWTLEAAMSVLLTFVVGIGLLAVFLLVRLAAADRLGDILVGGRLASPTGYFNSSVALFMMDALLAAALAARRRFPAPLRGFLLALGTASLQLAVVGESRGWLFTLPLVLILSFAAVRERTRFLIAAALPAFGTLLALHSLLGIYKHRFVPDALAHAARSAGRASLLLCVGVLVIASLLAWADDRVAPSRVSHQARRVLSVVVVSLAVAAGCVGALVATHGDPVGFAKRQWHGFTHLDNRTASSSYFATVGSGRYDFWRVSLKALGAHPLTGLGQDNFADYYLRQGHTGEEPAWTHSLEMRLIAHTGLVGLLLFALFLGAALLAWSRARFRRGDDIGWLAGACILPLIVWLTHGSVDWFWEMPALSGPALGFLGVAVALARAPDIVGSASVPVKPSTRLEGRIPKAGLAGILLAAVCAASVVLGFPYLATREVATANRLSRTNPAAALDHLSTAARLNPLSPLPGRVGGTIALQTGRFEQAEQRFRQSIARQPDGWFAWLGAGLAASQLGDIAAARHDLRVAATIDRRQPAILNALTALNSGHPVRVTETLNQIVIHR